MWGNVRDSCRLILSRRIFCRCSHPIAQHPTCRPGLSQSIRELRIYAELLTRRHLRRWACPGAGKTLPVPPFPPGRDTSLLELQDHEHLCSMWCFCSFWGITMHHTDGFHLGGATAAAKPGAPLYHCGSHHVTLSTNLLLPTWPSLLSNLPPYLLFYSTLFIFSGASNLFWERGRV